MALKNMSETFVIKMPQLSDTMTEGVVVSWEKKIGDKIARGDIVATVETDKAIMDVEVFREGYLSGPMAAINAVVPVGNPMAYLVDRAEQVQGSDAAPARKDLREIKDMVTGRFAAPSHYPEKSRLCNGRPRPAGNSPVTAA